MSEKTIEIKRGGDMNALVSKLSNDTGVPYVSIVKLLPATIPFLTEKQAHIIRRHFLQGVSLEKIKTELGSKSYHDLEASIDASIKKLEKEITKTIND